MLNINRKETDKLNMKHLNQTNIVASINTNWLTTVQSIVLSMEKTDKSKPSNMESEILEQPAIIADLMSKYVTPEKYILINLPLNIKKVILIASGSSYHCASITAELLKENANCDAECVYSSEFILNEKIETNKDTLFIFVSQSGETTDTLEALKKVSKITDKILCVTNSEESTIWQLSNYKVLTYAGKEQSIASTKAMSAQLFCLYLVVLKIMYSKGIDTESEINYLANIPTALEEVFKEIKMIKTVAKKLSKYQNISILGSRTFYSLAKEGALKIKETSYINTTAYPQGEFMHGHVAILNQKSALITLVDEENNDIITKNIEKIKHDYNPLIVCISNIENPTLNNLCSYTFKLNGKTKIFAIFSTLVTLQLFALEIAKCLKRNIDRPTGLKKVVIN